MPCPSAALPRQRRPGAGIVTPDRTAWAARALLSFTRIDLLENLVSTQAWTTAGLRQEIRDVPDRILGPR
jgi:hypothetical protein